MKNSIQVALIVFLSATVFKSNAQARVFITYEEYTANTGETYDRLSPEFGYGINTIHLYFIKSGEKVGIKSKGIWGFISEDTLYRIHPNSGIPLKVLWKNKACYYVSKEYQTQGKTIDTEKRNQGKQPSASTTYSGTNTGGMEYFSLEINSQLHVLSNGFTTEDKKIKKELNKLKELYPALSGLFDCIYKKSPLVITPEAIQNRGKDGRIDYHPPKAWYLDCFKVLE